ncbi:MAG: DNA-directed RNA polymerase subunit omega [Cytophagales bacterium]|nr:DNA-directed RNA polymerase subunit omega [Armatimonadota bacterium]
MIYPSADKIDKNIESKYALVILAAKRAKQIKEGSRARIHTSSVNPLTIALEEIAAGEIKYTFDANSLAGREALADKEAVVGSRDLSVEGVDPLALPENLDALAKATSALGGDLPGDDSDAADDDTEEEVAEEEEEEDNPLLLADEDVEEPEI